MITVLFKFDVFGPYSMFILMIEGNKSRLIILLVCEGNKSRE